MASHPKDPTQNGKLDMGKETNSDSTSRSITLTAFNHPGWRCRGLSIYEEQPMVDQSKTQQVLIAIVCISIALTGFAIGIGCITGSVGWGLLAAFTPLLALFLGALSIAMLRKS